VHRARIAQFVTDLAIQSELVTRWRLGWANMFAGSQRHGLLVDVFARLLPHTLGYPLAALAYIVSCGRFPASFHYPVARCFTSHLCTCAQVHVVYHELRRIFVRRHERHFGLPNVAEQPAARFFPTW
jgi:hypothetical protein